jgi:hypothetical protein
MNLYLLIPIIIGSLASIGFGVWHFFVPSAWKWYAYIDKSATELVTAVRAVNVFFSLSLVLFGLVNILLAAAPAPDRYSLLVVLAATCVLWLVRVIMQIIFPQGAIDPRLRYGMLAAFVVIFLCYFIPLILLAIRLG